MKRINKPERLQGIIPSDIRRLFSLAQSIPGVISLGIGEPDSLPPPHIRDAAKRALDEGQTHYMPTAGTLELRNALTEKARHDYHLQYDPTSEVLVTIGGTEAIFLALLTLIEPGDEVLIPNPGFVCYRPSVLMAGGIPVSMPLLEENNFTLNAETVMPLITDKSRVILINTPNNPTGSVFPYNDLAGLAKLAVERDLVVISDEVYEKITYDNSRHHCLATFPNMHERTVIVNSFSKTYAMTGLRVGYALGPESLITPMILAHQFITACVSGPAQYAAVAALNGPQDFVRDMVKEFERRRRLLHTRLNEIEGFKALLPKGAFYIFVDIRAFSRPSREFASYLLDKARVLTVAGSAFGEYGEGYLRLSYASAYEKIEEALDRVEETVKGSKLQVLPSQEDCQVLS
ncbi:MAG: pyridoxal phosphate-dependent aminotransferase [Candidatus Bathyarchaeota archaeon]|nr:MAG: pyridoxal phosphate-dependent aminotransferase [Candidatus Bathyarchaeota archaeon]